jgi:hypothetical protein
VNNLRGIGMGAMWAKRTVCHKCGGEFTVNRYGRVCVPCRNEYHIAYRAKRRLASQTARQSATVVTPS